MTDELYCRLVCALSHNLNACDSCKKCGETSPDARINLIRELAREENMPLPWVEDNNKEQYSYLILSYALDLACQRLSKDSDCVRPNWLREELIEEAENNSLIKKTKYIENNNQID